MVEEPQDWGFNYSDRYVERTFSIWVLSSYVRMPRAGGLDDQDPLWLDDMIMCMLLQRFQEQDYPDKLKDFFDAQGNENDSPGIRRRPDLNPLSRERD